MRNIFARTQPDFSQLLGSKKISFKRQQDLWLLSKAILLRYFGLAGVEAPVQSLCPAIPNRFEYVCWVKQLQQIVSLHGYSWEHAGLDIGCGNIAIYCLLACSVYNFRMLGVELQAESLENAKAVVAACGLSAAIELVLAAEDGCVLATSCLPEGDRRFLFCMCNPPFYANEAEMQQQRAAKATASKGKASGAANEFFYSQGGELGFIRRMLFESAAIGNKIW